MDEVTHTILPGSGSGWGGTALGAGFGGLIGSWLGNGGFGGFGGNRAGIGYDTGAINGIQGQLNNISGQIANADRDLLMQTSNQNQFVGNLINSTGDAITGAIAAGTCRIYKYNTHLFDDVEGLLAYAGVKSIEEIEDRVIIIK